MAQVTMAWFTRALANAFGGETAGEASSIDWMSDTVRFAFLNALPNQDTAEFWSDVSATAVSGTNWAAAGVALTGKAILVDNATNRVGLDADDVNVADVTIAGTPITHAVVYKDTGTPTTSPLLGFGTFDTASGSGGGAVVITFAATGVLTITAT